MPEELLRTSLHNLHVALGARMVPFAGWSMPLFYEGVTAEHVHTRTACSLFDVSHMGRLRISGDDAEKFLNWICTRNLADAEVGRSYYSHVCREDGGILDDVIVSRFDTHWGIVCNAGNRERILRWLESHRTDFRVAVADETFDTTMLAAQGPRTMALAEELTGLDLSRLRRYRFSVHEFLGIKVTVYRSGYTGEDGLEVVFPSAAATLLVPRLLGTPGAPHPVIRPAGLGARDTLRIEAGMPLYGHELSEEVDSLSAGQGWCVDLSKEFIGAPALRALQKGGFKRQMTGLELAGKRIARQGFPVFCDERQVGTVTSGTLGPTVGKSVAMAFVEMRHRAEGTRLQVGLGSRRIGCRVVSLPFYKRSA